MAHDDLALERSEEEVEEEKKADRSSSSIAVGEDGGRGGGGIGGGGGGGVRRSFGTGVEEWRHSRGRKCRKCGGRRSLDGRE